MKGNRLKEEPQKSGSDLGNILFIRMDHLGDIVASLPSLVTLREGFPNSKISILTAEWGVDGFEFAEDFYDELIVWSPPWHDKRSVYYNKDVLSPFKLVKFFKFISRLRKKHFDLVIQPRGEGMNVVTAALLRADTIVSCVSPQRPLAMLMRRWISVSLLLNPYRTYHISEWSKLCLERINVQVLPDTLSRFRECPDERAEHPELARDIEMWRSKGFKVCGLGISAGSVVRLWSPRKFGKLIDRLYRENIICVLIGSESDKSIRGQIDVSAPCVDIVGKTNFRDLKKIVNDMDLVITLDTSLAHLASLLDKKTVTLFGAGNLELSRPVFNESCAILKRELGCSGCGDMCLFSKRLPKKQAPCMDLISVGSVTDEVRKFLVL
jgi:heptosyltransferase-1